MTDSPTPANPEQLRSVHSTTFPTLLEQCGISLAISTYQANKLILARADRGQLNTHFRPFERPMGMARRAEKLAIGTNHQIWELRNVPAVTRQLTPPESHPDRQHDACFLPRRLHYTGDIDIHEMAYADITCDDLSTHPATDLTTDPTTDQIAHSTPNSTPTNPAHDPLDPELWFINTRFSCLCTLDTTHSFVPRWRPPFITGYDLTDRCHLNGLALREGQPRYVTALGQTDTPAGWRKQKASGGMVMDISNNERIADRLSMPHSPRWYRDRLWVLESGRGSLSTVDLHTGKLTDIACLPGFTRGLDFYGNFAFIGLSQVRESAIFSGIEIAKQAERFCGVWVVDIVTGQVVALLRFEAVVQEVFAVVVLPGMTFPEVLTDDRALLGRSYVLPDEAMADVVALQAADLDRLPAIQFDRGVAHAAAGDVDAAIAAYRICLDLDPNHLDARYHLALALAQLDRPLESIAELNRVIHNDPNHIEALWQLGEQYVRLGNYDQAQIYRDLILAIDPDGLSPEPIPDESAKN
ncbi:MAG: TIGR03032 family protein [Coleofasciculaceae cyanobacterium RL_1_1]|nr:TIGR03032 family protein [Coleofasciculaceae cyanobacterium RL_1_1]